MTPDARHFGRDHAQLAKRRAVDEAARAEHPERLSRSTRNWHDRFDRRPSRLSLATDTIVLLAD